jgi:hypothetical protein
MVRPIIITVAPKMNDAGLLSVIEHALDLEEMSGSKWKLIAENQTFFSNSAVISLTNSSFPNRE